jgi:hypothetical protein
MTVATENFEGCQIARPFTNTTRNLKEGKNMGISELLKEKREAILRIAAKHGARNVRVFGSAARGEADEESGLDLHPLPHFCLSVFPFFPSAKLPSAKLLNGSAISY